MKPLHAIANWIVIAVSVSIAIRGGDLSAAPPTSTAKADIVAWLQKAESSLRASTHKERFSVFAGLADQYASLGEFDRAKDCVEAITDKEYEYSHGAAQARVCLHVAEAKGPREAMEYADTLPPNVRGFCLRFLASCLLDRHMFDAAEAAIRRQTNSTRIPVWESFVRTLASSGKYDRASQVLETLQATTDDEKRDKEHLRQHIAECRASNRHDKPRSSPKSLGGVRRSVLQLFGDAAVPRESLEEARKWVETQEGVLNKAAGWRQVAWMFLERGQLDECRKAVGESLAYSRTIPESAHKDLNLLMIADLQLELGEKAQAASLVESVSANVLATDPGDADQGSDADGDEELRVLGRRFSRSFDAPLALDVLVRADRVDTAVNVAKRSKVPQDWMAISARLAEQGRMDTVNRLLKDVPEGIDRAYFELGVAEGLYWQIKKSDQR